MTETVLAAAGAAIMASATSGVDETYVVNPTPTFALLTSFPGHRFEQASSSIYLTPRADLVPNSLDAGRIPMRSLGGTAEFLDVLPAAEAMSYEMAVAIGRQVTSLVRDDSPDVDLGSAL